MFSIANFSLGFAAGFGTGFISREIVAGGGAVLRPLVKGTVKTGMFAFEKSREMFAHLGESLDDLVAEARSEIDAGVGVVPAVAEGSGDQESARVTKRAGEGSSSEEPKSKEKSKTPKKEQA